MEFGLAIDTTSEINLIQSLSDNLTEYFKNKWYGADIKSYTIGVVCISPQFEQFFKGKKPKYTKEKKLLLPMGFLLRLKTILNIVSK